MAAYILRRLLWTAPVLLGIAVITFVLMHAVPGGPWEEIKGPDDAARERLDHAYGLDKPLWEQLGIYLLHAARGDLGVSLTRAGNPPVTEVLREKIPVSATLGLLALGVSASFGTLLGVVSALWRNSLIDYAAIAFATVSASLPTFVLGILLLLLFTTTMQWPTTGWGSARQAVLPVLALSALPAAYIARVARAAMLDVLHEDYVRTARAKGLREQVVVLRHMLRNALLPVLTVSGPIAAALVTGSFIVEELFAIPGIGRAFVGSFEEKDYGLIMGITLFYAFAVVTANLVVDVLYSAVDPRIRRQTHG
jgi:oligopeptide transport system permease protein